VASDAYNVVAVALLDVVGEGFASCIAARIVDAGSTTSSNTKSQQKNPGALIVECCCWDLWGFVVG
jgi:hypothetical protein